MQKIFGVQPLPRFDAVVRTLRKAAMGPDYGGGFCAGLDYSRTLSL